MPFCSCACSKAQANSSPQGASGPRLTNSSVVRFISSPIGRDDLSGRPVKCSSAQQVHVQMKNGLPRAAAGVHHCAVTAAQFFFARKFCRHQRDFSEYRLVLGSRFLQRSEVFLRPDQDMRRRLWIYVLECKHFFVVVNQLCRNLLCRDFAEQAIVSHWSPPAGTSSRRMTMV